MVVPILKMGKLNVGEVKSLPKGTQQVSRRWERMGREEERQEREGPGRQDGEGHGSFTREALGTVLVPVEVVVLVPGREGQGEAAGRDSDGAQLAGHRCGELQAVGRVFATQVDGELQRLGIALPVLQLHSQTAAAVPQDLVHLLQAQPELSYSRRDQWVRWGPTSMPLLPLYLWPLWKHPPWRSPKPAL